MSHTRSVVTSKQLSTTATNRSKDELVKCPVCFKIYDDPVMLSCLHTVCSDCVKWSGSPLNTFRCPVCGDNIKDSVRDHSKKALVQMYHKHTSLTLYVGGKDGVDKPTKSKTVTPKDSHKKNQDTQHDYPIKCGTCNLNSNIVEWKCKECEQCLCKGCKDIHDAIPTCKSHFVQSMAAVAQDIKSSAKQYHCHLSNAQKELSLQLENFLKYRNQIDRASEKAIGSVNDHEDMCIKAVKDHHKALRDTIQSTKTKLVQQLNKEEKTLQSVKGEFDRNVKSIEQLQKTDNSVMVVYYAQQKSSDIKELVDKISTSIPREIIPPHLEFSVDKVDRLEIKPTISLEPVIDYMQIKYEGTEMENQVATYDYNHLLTHVLKADKVIPLRYSPRRLRMIDDHIWCAGTAAFYVYKTDGTLVTTITHDKIQQVKAMTKTQSGHVIVACWDGKGLLQLDKNGQFQLILQKGSFSDVVSCRNKLYALSYEDSTIHLFTYSAGNEWKHDRAISLPYTNGNNWDSLCVHVNTIYVCSWANSSISHYNLMGQLLSQYGTQSKTPSAGHFNHPRICDIDSNGTLLVVDTDNHKIQVQEHGGNWGYISTTVDIRRPIDAMVNPSNGDVWIIQNIPGQTHSMLKLTDRNKVASSP